MKILTSCIGHDFGRNVCLLDPRLGGLSEDIPWLYGPKERYDWCFAQEFKRSKDLTAILETVLGAEQAGAAKRPAPSITSPPMQRKKTKKNSSETPMDRRCTAFSLKPAPRYCNILLRVERIHWLKEYMSVRSDNFRTLQCNTK